jgi:hypothetical protein
MDRLRQVGALLIGDDELECNCKDKTIDDINISMIAFSPDTLKKYDLIIYSGSKGTKIVKSTYTMTGKVV